ncbi:hypothetical protein FRIG_14525 [Frigoribacterium faeni]|uniref:hypothetical protein n=3 Tax=Bacillati TaxID=1783272 RepID=UPI001FACD6B3|nr:hypothetical protein [Frigoribacterium faeni]MCJ0700608.1 hypothetical protein [Frigoribacterium faeni]MCJ0702305.1 hypothetical protein [Frigoribacterium faeni]MCJ0702333.1 hypothetical protein [Frigoribacterium faeni]
MNAFSRKKITKVGLGLVASGALVFSLAACSMDSNSGSTESTTSASASAEPSAEATPVASLPDLSNGVDTQVTVDQSFVDALTSLGLTPAPVGTGTFDGATGTFAFPITGGNVDYYDPSSDVRPYVQGELDHDGSGLSLTAGDTTVELTDFRIDPGESKLYGTVSANGEVVVEDAYLFNLWGGTLKPLQMEGTNAVLEGTTVHISPDAAALLNETFSTDAVQDEMLVGVAKITVATE